MSEEWSSSSLLGFMSSMEVVEFRTVVVTFSTVVSIKVAIVAKAPPKKPV